MAVSILLDKKTFYVNYSTNRADDHKSIAQNSITALYKDNNGIIWAGTYKKGISYYHESIIKFPLYQHHLADPNSLDYDDVNKFAEDAKGNLWIGTNGGGLIYFDRKKNKYQLYKHSTTNTNSLCNDVIVSLWIDHEQKLWIGTYFGGLDYFDGQTFKHYKHNEADPNSISDDRVWEIMEDSQNRLWVGTLAGGLNLFDRKKNNFYRYRPYQPNSVHSAYISALTEDENGNIWIGTSDGIDVLQKKDNQFIRYLHDEKNVHSLVNNKIIAVFKDSRNLIWVTTREGLSIFNPQTKTFRNFFKEDGLPDNSALELREDNHHHIWLSTKNGLSDIKISGTNADYKLSFQNYNEKDGLQGREFNENAALKTRKGELLFGGSNGFNLFMPEQIKSNTKNSKVFLTDFQVFNKSLQPGEQLNGQTILSKSITDTKAVVLKYDDNVFSIEFAALNFFDPNKIKLLYRMEGFDKSWLTADNNIRKATYTNLDPGTYIFKVKAANADGVWNDQEAKLKITILPPLWRTTFAYFTYVFLVLGVLYLIRRRGIQKIKTEFALEQERQEVQRMHELDLMKIKFFTNVSHEFRTPISLIMAPVDKILSTIENTDQKLQLQMVNRNARRLLNLVNQLMDFRKMEVNELKLHQKRGDIILFIREVSFSFTDIADKKSIGFIFDTTIDNLETDFDHDKIERILFNLLSNAFKFTPEHGHISIMLDFKTTGEAYLLEIKIQDTGVGIPTDRQEKIFERFFQHEIPGSMVNQGSGIGLSIVKEFVKLQNGEITVESEENQGSCFTVLLPITLTNAAVAEQEPVQKFTPVKNATTSIEPKRTAKKETILLVEDNDDFRFYLKDNLKEPYHIIEAANGKEGWQKALALHPNLIVSDISMPEMNGIDLCQKIKQDNRTKHIPIILLTALIGEEQQLKGLETGASDYLTKPFNFEILLSKIKNLLIQQESMRKTYQKQVEVKPAEIAVESVDKKFMQQVLQVIEKNIDNPDFSVEELSAEVYISRVTLYKKLLALTGKTPVEFIRTIRLKRAVQLLETGQLTISQISYKVGFKSQKYFTKCFKSEFDLLPSEYNSEISVQI